MFIPFSSHFSFFFFFNWTCCAAFSPKFGLWVSNSPLSEWKLILIKWNTGPVAGGGEVIVFSQLELCILAESSACVLSCPGCLQYLSCSKLRKNLSVNRHPNVHVKFYFNSLTEGYVQCWSSLSPKTALASSSSSLSSCKTSTIDTTSSSRSPVFILFVLGIPYFDKTAKTR